MIDTHQKSNQEKIHITSVYLCGTTSPQQFSIAFPLPLPLLNYPLSKIF